MAKSKSFNLAHLARYKRMAINTMLVCLAAVLLGAMLWGGDDLWATVKAVPLSVIVVICMASLMENILRIYRYKLFAKSLRLPVPWGRMVLYYVAGMALLPTPGKVGVVLRLWLLKHHHRIPYRRSTPLLIMDFVTDTIAMMLLVGLGIMGLGAVKGVWVGIMLMGIIIGLLMLIIWMPSAIYGAIKLVYRLVGKRKPRLFAGLKHLIRLLHRTMGGMVLVQCTALSFVAWGGFGLALSYALMMMNYEPHWLMGGFVVSISTVMGVASMMPAGVGGAEASMAGLLVALAEVSWHKALVLTVLIRTALIWIPVVIGFIVLPWALQSPSHKPTKA